MDADAGTSERGMIMSVKYDNCKNCHSLCIHAGKDREFVCIKGVSCKITMEKPRTNADRIRAMSDEELAMCLYEIGYDEGWDKPEYALKWLRQPVAEDK